MKFRNCPVILGPCAVTQSKVQEVTRTIGSISNALIERIDAHMVDTKKMTEGISQEVEELRLDYSLVKEQINLEQKIWQNQAGGELDKVNDSVRLVEDRVTEMQAETRHKIQKANAEIVYLREQLEPRQPTELAIPNQPLPVTDTEKELDSLPISGLETNVGNYHMGKGESNHCTTSVRGNAKPQPNVDSNSGPAIVNVTSDVFANSSPINELTLPNFYDSSNQILHFLRDLDEYYRIKNVPESLKLPLAMRAVTDPTAKNLISTGTVNV